MTHPKPNPVDVGICTNTTMIGKSRYRAMLMRNPDTSAVSTERLWT